MFRVFAILAACVSHAATSSADEQGPWLPVAEQERLKAMWVASGVEFPTGGKFYALPRVSQRLVTVNSVECNGIFDSRHDGASNINQQYPWVVPAGLHWSPREQWRKATLAVLPGRIAVWRAYTPVLNSFGHYQQQPRISWAFADGTLFGEMLIRQRRGDEFAFEIRERAKTNGRWDGGTVYRPATNGAAAFAMQVPPGKLSDFGLGWATTTTGDDGLVPRGYVGTAFRCSECHDRAGESTSYGATALPGSDTVLSWHPFTADTLNTDLMPRLDRRWPLAR